MNSPFFSTASGWTIDGHTRLLGIIGDPVSHSLSPAMHNLAFLALGLNLRYLAFHVKPERLEEAVRGFAAQGMVGFNATIPHKEALVGLMDRLDDQVALLGAVNTVAIDSQGGLRGYNTDVHGFHAALEQAFPGRLQGARAVVLGAGGAARAVVAGLVAGGVTSITVANRTAERGQKLLEELAPALGQVTCRGVPLTAERIPLEECELLVNTTSMGLHGEPISGVDVSRLPKEAVVNDIVYSPPVTPLMQAALTRGLGVLNGLDMLIHQGAQAFRIWTGREMPIPLIKAHLDGLAAKA
ncbi:MAG: shikimate dehydrogenase [Magnetococcales bacterium]|nr:shikimate dehydrogenase [Magnetococcales bacterium]